MSQLLNLQVLLLRLFPFAIFKRITKERQFQLWGDKFTNFDSQTSISVSKMEETLEQVGYMQKYQD